MPDIVGVSNLKDEEIYCLKSSPFRRIFFIPIPGASIFNELIFGKKTKQKHKKKLSYK